MPTKITMPQLGESVNEGTIGQWLKQEGETVKKDEALVEIITDKVTAELPSPASGVLVKILVQADETVRGGEEAKLMALRDCLQYAELAELTEDGRGKLLIFSEHRDTLDRPLCHAYRSGQ